MLCYKSRLAALRSRHASTLAFILIATTAQAVVVRGHVTDALGKPLPGARVQLIEGKQVAALAYSDDKGNYEIRSADSGRFILLGLAPSFTPSIGQQFYAGSTDVVEQDVVLATGTVHQDITVEATGLPTPLPQLTAPVSILDGGEFVTHVGVTDEMSQTPGVELVQSGQAGSVTSLFMRGGNSTANLVLIDGIPAEDVGGIFDYGTVSSTGIGHMELYRGPNSAMYGTDAGAAVITIDTPRGSTLKPVLNYSGDFGNLHSWRNEAIASGTWDRLDFLAAISRFDTSNALQLDRYHSTTSAANVGFNLDANTDIRFTIRNAGSVQGVPGAYDFQGVSTSGREADQDLYSGVTLENRTRYDWHNLIRYGIARKREQAAEFNDVGNFLAYDPGNYGPGYVGNVVTIRGANGYSAKGQVQLYTGNKYDQASNRDQLYYQSDYSPSKHFNALFGFRYDNERGVFNDYYSYGGYIAPPENEKVQRTNFEYNLQFQGSFFDRVFYSMGGALEKNHLYGIAGTPKIGFAYVPVRSSTGFFHGTRLRANAATGVQEPTLALEYSSLYHELLTNNGASSIAAYHVHQPGAERSRTYDIGIDQNIYGEKLVFKAGYFHNMFDHQLEGISPQALAQYFNIGTAPPCAPYTTPVNGICPLTTIYSAYVNSLAFRAQGVETELTWKPVRSVLLHGGYTYLAARVVQSFSSDALAAGGTQYANPNLPTTPIGIFGPLAGGRPFRRAPNTGFFALDYNKRRFSAVMQAHIASRSDDSTYLEYEDLSGGNTLLLPNRDLDFGYTKLDLGITYAYKPAISFFAQAENLLNDQHIGPIGYPGLPLTVRVGVKLRLGGD